MNQELKARLIELGLSEDQVNKLLEQGVTVEADMRLLTAEDIQKFTDCNLLTSRRIVAWFNQAPTVASAAPTSDVVPEGGNPTQAQLSSFASGFGLDPAMLQVMALSSLTAGMGMGDMDVTSMMPASQMLGSYSPKRKDVAFWVMGQIERRLGTKIIVINGDGSVNIELTLKYITMLEDGFPPYADGVYLDDEGKPFEIIAVGVDAQSIYDADPVNSEKPLPQNGIGTGRIKWKGVNIDVRQMVFLAVTKTRELDPNDQQMLARLRDKITPSTTRLDLAGDFPQAHAAYNEALRTGSLPTLRVQQNRSARRPETMPRRRTAQPRDLTGYPSAPRILGDNPVGSAYGGNSDRDTER